MRTPILSRFCGGISLLCLLIILPFHWEFPVPSANAEATGNAGPPVAVAGQPIPRQDQEKHLLMITSQPYVTDWFIALDGSLRKRISSSLLSEANLSYEYIGSESMTDPQYDKILCDWLKKKYDRIRFDAIIAVMPVGSRFLLDHGDELFPDIPHVYALPSREQLTHISARPRSGAVKSASNPIPETIQRIRSLLPDTERLLVVSGSGQDDLNYQQEAEKAIQSQGWPKTVEYLTGLPVDKLTEELGHVNKRSAVLMLTYVQDRDGRPLTTVQVMKAVADKSRAPIFSFYDTVMGLGIVGGKLSSAESFGEAVAETVLSLVTAADPTPMPVTGAETKDIYDWRQIEKWKIPKSRLPQDSDIRYRKVSFFDEYLAEIITVSLIVLLQALLIVALIVNLFKRRRAEKELRDSERKYHDIFDNAVMGIYQSTPEGIYINVNPTLARTFGYATPEEMMADIQDIRGEVYVDPEDRTRFMEVLEREGVVKGFETEFKRRDGSRFWVSIDGKAIRDERGKLFYYDGTIEDVTAQKRAEQELAAYRTDLERMVKERTAELETAKERAESADRIKSAFLATMSHELRTPLNSIIGFTGIILQGIVGPLNDEQKKQLGMVRGSAHHLLSLINDVLDISKIEAGQLRMTFEPFDLHEVVEKTVANARPLAEKKGLALTCAVSEGICTIRADRRRVEQVLLNLIGNAVKFTERGSITVKCESDSDGVRVSVTDTGIGIRAEDQETIFQAFRQVDSGTNRRYEGTGLGLPISRRLVELMGGRIRVESRWGSGSTFSFTLPRERKV